MKHGFVTVAAAVPTVRVADVNHNVAEIGRMIHEAEKAGVEIVTFPELSVTGYSCQDLFFQQTLLEKTEQGMKTLMASTRELDVIAIVGLPVPTGALLLNAAAVIQHGRLLGIVAKTFLPNYGEFYEKRWFASAEELTDMSIAYAGQTVGITSQPQSFMTADGVSFGIEICEDLWAPIPPGRALALAGNELIFNLSADNELAGKHRHLKTLVAQQSACTISGYVYCGCGFGESTQDVVYGGKALIYENGECMAEGERFAFDSRMTVAQIDVDRLRGERRRNTTFIQAQKGYTALKVACEARKDTLSQRPFELTRRNIDRHPFVPKGEERTETFSEILNIQTAGLAKRLVHTGCRKVIVGVSGGLDSTLALLVCIKTYDKLGYDRKDIIGITMPGFGTTDRTYANALSLMKMLGVTIREISIAASVTQHFQDIGHDISCHDMTYENAQARERTQILMDVANQVGGMVVGTGDLSELALGWATYNGDHMSMYGLNASVPKTLAGHLVRHFADTYAEKAQQNGTDNETATGIKTTLYDIINTPISPELVPADIHGNITQKTEDLVGPYELHDFFLYYMLRFGFRPQKIFLLCCTAFKGVYTQSVIKKWLHTFIRRFFAQQFKRSCLPDGPKVGHISLSPRGDWRMPSDASATEWLAEVEGIITEEDV